MTLKELKFFFYLCENSHISELSKTLNISQSAISIAIKSLESKLGEQLFDRIGKKLILNERGKTFREHTVNHYNALVEYQKAFKDNMLSGELNIAVSKTINNYVLPQVIYEFIKKYPSIKIKKTIVNSSDIIKMILDSKTDLGFVESHFNHPQIHKTKLCEDELIIVTSDKKLASEKRYIDTLFNKDWILREVGSGTREVFLEKLDTYYHDLNIVLESSEFEEIKTLLLNNSNTLTCISKAVVNNELKQKNLYQVDLINFEFKREFNLLYHKNKTKSTVFQEFEKFCFDYFLSMHSL